MAIKDKKLTRSHDRQKRRRKVAGQAERFYLQGARWRFPSEIGLGEVEVRIGGLRAAGVSRRPSARAPFFSIWRPPRILMASHSMMPSRS